MRREKYMFSFGSSARDLLKLVTPSYRSGVSPELKWKAVISLPYPKKKERKRKGKKRKRKSLVWP